MATTEQIEKTRFSLDRMQKFDAKKLARTDDFGLQFSFAPVVPFAEKIINLYKRIPQDILEDLPEALLNQLRGAADSDFSRFQQILDFDVNQPNNSQARKSIIQGIEAGYEQSFSIVWNFISYGVARVTDSTVLENQARATLQSIRDEAKETIGALTSNRQSADDILTTIKKVAAEQGVSQEAKFFKDQADHHKAEATIWATRLGPSIVAIALLAVASLFVHKIPFLAPQTNIEAAQLITSKIIIFAVAGFALALSARSYLSHKHNEVVNRHRQTALQTYTTLADAAKEDGPRDIIVAYAASCIFSPQETGYTKGDTTSGAKSVLELLTKSTPKAAE